MKKNDIIPLLAVLVIGQMSAFADSPKKPDGVHEQRPSVQQQNANQQKIRIALKRYQLDLEGFPTSEQGLKALLKSPSGAESKWRGPYLGSVDWHLINGSFEYISKDGTSYTLKIKSADEEK